MVAWKACWTVDSWEYSWVVQKAALRVAQRAAWMVFQLAARKEMRTVEKTAVLRADRWAVCLAD
jgi:hypothetical protein